jgi:transcriptional regulator with XRE-family HTH domain
LTAAQLKRALAKAGLSQRGAAKRLEINERTMRRYVSGEQPVPRVVECALYWLSDSDEQRKAFVKWGAEWRGMGSSRAWHDWDEILNPSSGDSGE